MTLLCLTSGTRVAAQEVRELDAGRFELRSGERRLGIERFRIWRDRGEINALAQIELEEGAGGVIDVGLRADNAFRPIEYQYRTRGGATSVTGIWSGDRLRLHITTADGERWKEMLTRGPVAVLEEGVAHHFALLFRQLGDVESGARISVVEPSRGAQATASVHDRRNEVLTIGGVSVASTRYEVTVNGTSYEVWIDGEGRLLQLTAEGVLRAIRLPRGS